MKDKTMAKAEWRTVQFFLSARGIFEVKIDLTSDGVECTCPGYEAKGACKHTRYVVAKAKENNGVYPLKISTRAPMSENKAINNSEELFREFVLKYGKIEVL
ncbi:MAG: hypothetical protein EBX50_07945 [Chitinophagia bacterium]|nr:hypothetical protein [Chitinophagia bacterium]